MDHDLRVLIVQLAQSGLGIDDIQVDLSKLNIAIDRDAVKRVVMSAGGSTGAGIGRDAGPNKEAGR